MTAFIACKGAFSREWVQWLGHDIAMLFEEALSRPGGALAARAEPLLRRDPSGELSGFADIISHPWVVAVCTAVLGPDYKIVEAGFDVPGPGAMKQPWHRDFPSPEATLVGRRLNSLAFNITTVDVTEDMGPFEIAPGTQWDDLSGGDPMFPRAGAADAVRGAGAAQAGADGRYLGAVGADHPPRDGQPVAEVAAGVRAGRGCAGCDQRGQA